MTNFAVETVKIANADHESGFIIIDKADFNEKEHKLFDEKSKAKGDKKDDDKSKKGE